MTMPSIPDRLAANRYVTDEDESHIEIDQELCERTGTGDRIIAVCPAKVYSRAPDGRIVAEYAACFECGACLAVASPGALVWHYPRGGMGIQLREG